MFSKYKQALAHTFNKKIGDKTNQNKRNKRSQSQRRIQKDTSDSLTHGSAY